MHDTRPSQPSLLLTSGISACLLAFAQGDAISAARLLMQTVNIQEPELLEMLATAITGDLDFLSGQAFEKDANGTTDEINFAQALDAVGAALGSDAPLSQVLFSHHDTCLSCW